VRSGFYISVYWINRQAEFIINDYTLKFTVSTLPKFFAGWNLAFSVSKNTAAVDSLLLKLRVTWSVSLINCNVVLWRARKPNWLALSGPLSYVCFWRIIRITFSNSLPVVDRRLIGRKFWIFTRFGKVITFATFKGFGKCDSRRLRLNKRIKCTIDRSGKCLRHSFGMPLIIQAFLNFRVFISFCMSHGLILWVGLFSTDSTSAWTLASTCRSWFQLHKSCGERNFQAVRSFIGFLRWKEFEAWSTMNSSWCPWSIHLKEQFRNGPYSLWCDFSVTYFRFHAVQVPFYGSVAWLLSRPD
jgi:hypothetical protein